MTESPTITMELEDPNAVVATLELEADADLAAQVADLYARAGALEAELQRLGVTVRVVLTMALPVLHTAPPPDA
jgi:hypothetical protein